MTHVPVTEPPCGAPYPPLVLLCQLTAIWPGTCPSCGAAGHAEKCPGQKAIPPALGRSDGKLPLLAVPLELSQPC